MTREVPAVNGRLSWLGPGLSWKWMFATLSPALSRSLHVLDEYPRGGRDPFVTTPISARPWELGHRIGDRLPHRRLGLLQVRAPRRYALRRILTSYPRIT